MAIKDITGKKYNKLTAIKFDHIGKEGGAWWLFKCDCGTEKVIRASSVVSGGTRSCGCTFKEYNDKRRVYIHGMTLKELYSKYDCAKRLLNVYNKIISRCEKPNDLVYRWYGAKGVTVCKEWRDDFLNFMNWCIENGYDMKKSRTEQTIDRINPFKGYSPENCRLIPLREQHRNKRKSYMRKLINGK